MTQIPDPYVVSSVPGLRFADFHLHPDGTLVHGDRQIHLAPKELAALRVLLRHSGKLVTAAQLQKELWGEIHVTPDSVPRCISALRMRLGSDSCIQTVYKQGYRLLARVRQDPETADAAIPRLAIMPFAAGPSVPDHLGSAVAEEVTALLTLHRPRFFSMLARDSVFALAARGMSAQQAGEALKANAVLTGTIQALALHFRLRAEMVLVEDGTQLWVEDVLVLRERSADLAATVVERLAFRSGCALPGGEPGTAIDPHAYDLLLRARHEWQSLDRNRMQEGIRHLHRAAELDPKLVQVPLELVRATVAQELFGYLEPADAALQVRNLAESLRATPHAAEAIAPALAWMAFHVDRDLPAALELVPPWTALPIDSWGLRLRALFAAGRLQFDEAAAILQHALGEDPFSPWIGAALAWVHHLAGRAEESALQIRRCLETAPSHAATRLYGGMILAYQGDTQQAVALTSELVRPGPQLATPTAAPAYALARHGDRAQAEECLERLQWLSRERYVIRSFSAAAYLALDDPDSAVAELSAANESRCPWFFQMIGDPRLHGLRHRAEFQQFLALAEQMEVGVREQAGAADGMLPAGAGR
jgi:DNA-binding winged helix-turn-helix (wHTH) protein/tetratricopeptide (TPR) repeat protein